jgi:hypothetical protein
MAADWMADRNISLDTAWEHENVKRIPPGFSFFNASVLIWI